MCDPNASQCPLLLHKRNIAKPKKYGKNEKGRKDNVDNESYRYHVGLCQLVTLAGHSSYTDLGGQNPSLFEFNSS